ncbi:MAG TPA: hypothetical protein EYQ04_04000, partial [Candidatus Thioglobus sp.]|nr:hypothetical protein [Candidatus Thioglobus sp.]
MTFIWLWTDFLLWVLFALSFYAIIKIRQNDLLRQKWKKIFSQPLALSAFIVFSFYILIGLTDSLHFRFDNDTTAYSVLDRVLLPALEADEKTYSTPLNYQQFSKEYLENGLRGRVHLNLVSQQINSPSENYSQIFNISIQALIYSIFAIFILVLIGKKALAINPSIKINRVAFITLFGVIFFCIWTILMMPNYHILGTDKAGIDVFYKAVKSIR